MDRVEYMVLETAGYVSPQAEAELQEVLQTTPEDPRGRYYAGLTLAQAGRPDMTYGLWARLLAEGPPDAPWVRAIQPQMGRIAAAAGRSAPPGPSAEDFAAAAVMSDEERAAMARGMVAGLAERLATEGGPAEDWARLIRALGVLGELRQASDIWKEAQTTFAAAPSALALLRSAAQDAEVSQ